MGQIIIGEPFFRRRKLNIILLEIPLLGLSQVRSLLDKGFLYLLSSNFFSQILSFGTSLLITRFLDPVELGETKILQSYIILFLVFAGAGFNATILKYCSENRSQENREFLLRFSLYRTLLTTAVVLLVLTVLALIGSLTSTAHLTSWLLIYALAIPFIVVTDILSVFLLATKRAKELSAVQVTNKAIAFVLIVLCTWVWKVEGFVIGALAAGILGVFFPLSKVSAGFLKAPSGRAPAGIYPLAFFSALAGGITILGQYGDVFILDHFVADRQAIGYYSLATFFILAASQFTMTIQSTLTPYFSENRKDRIWLKKNLIQNQLLAIALSLLVSAGVYAAGWVLIRFVYGSQYQPSLNYLLILLLKYILFSSYAVISSAFIGLGLVKYNFIAVAISTPVGLLLSFLLQQDYSATGVAWAQVIANTLTLGVSLLFLWRLFVNPAMYTSIQDR
jgi:O-antigen/teichoic acid export membrane protein